MSYQKLLKAVTSKKSVEEVQRDHNIEVLKESIERHGLNSTFWCVFDAYLHVIGEKEWDQAIEMMPGSVQKVAEKHGFEANLDWDFWGQSTFFGLQFDAQRFSDTEQNIIDNWYENDYSTYCKAISLIEEGMWRITEEDIEYEDFCIAYQDMSTSHYKGEIL